jgi:TolB protein
MRRTILATVVLAGCPGGDSTTADGTATTGAATEAASTSGGSADPTESSHDLTTGADAHEPKILFFSSRSGDEQLFWMNPDGSDQALLVDIGSQQGGGPVEWTPSGANVVFTRASDVWRLHPESGTEQNITDDTSLEYLVRVSPDGSRLLVVSDRETNRANLFVIGTGGGTATRITDEMESHFYADFAPDGARIVYVVRPMIGDARLVVTTIVGNTPKEIGADLGLSGFSDVAWSPDGSLIAFIASDGEDSSLHVVKPDGTGLVKMGTDGWGQPVWAPDGQSLVFRSGEGVAVIGRDGSGELLLTPAGMGCYYPDISPDGATVVLTCFSDDQDGRNIYTVPITGGELTRLTQDTVDNQIAKWRP